MLVGTAWAAPAPHARLPLDWTTYRSHVPAPALAAVAAIAPGDAWAVGYDTADRPCTYQALAEHWDGTRWRVTRTPNPRRKAITLTAVDGVAGDDVWAVGDATCLDTLFPSHPVVEHWNGPAWTRTVLPGPIGSFLDVATLAPDDAWAVGQHLSLHDGSSVPLVAHWDGSSWSTMTLPATSSYDVLRSVSAFGPDDVWAVGASLTDER